jgi:hypothetical protein
MVCIAVVVDIYEAWRWKLAKSNHITNNSLWLCGVIIYFDQVTGQPRAEVTQRARAESAFKQKQYQFSCNILQSSTS